MNPLLTAKDELDVVPVVFDFTLQLGAATINSASVAVSVVAAASTGSDANPNNLKSGLAAISGAKVSQMLTGGVVGVTYHLRCTIITSDSRTIVLAADIPVITA
jgi:hypothetical protein